MLPAIAMNYAEPPDDELFSGSGGGTEDGDGGRLSGARRLTHLRQLHYKSAMDAVRAMNTELAEQGVAEENWVKYITYKHHEVGRRLLTWDAAVTYGNHYRVSAGYLLRGIDASYTVVSGIVSAGGAIFKPLGNDKEGPNLVAAPPDREPFDLAALRVETDDLWPSYRTGDVVWYDQKAFTDRLDWRRVEGRECVVAGAVGETYDTRIQGIYASVERGIGTFAHRAAIIHAHNGKPQTAIIERAAPVLWIRRAQAED